MSTIPLTPLDLGIVACLVLALAGLNARLGMGQGRDIVVAALRTTVQLLLIGFVLEAIFAVRHWGLVLAMGLVMVLAAGREVVVRQRRPLGRGWGYGIGTGAMFLSSFAVTTFALLAVLGPSPWYEPRYAIPLLGMLLGNTMTGIALGLDRLTEGAHSSASAIEGRLMLGATADEAIADIRRESARAGLTPILNSMAAAGLVSLPGMMTGQILAGSPPLLAVQYQILIMFLITLGTGLGTILAIWLGARRLFDDRHRLRLDRLKS